MFGSSFDQNFGLPAFPFQGADPQGGALGVNVPPQSDPAAAQAAPPVPGGPLSAPQSGAPAQPALGAPSPLGPGALSPAGPLPGAPETPAAGQPPQAASPLTGKVA